MPRPIRLDVELGDITAYPADVVALKHAQAFYGADRAVARALARDGTLMEDLAPERGDHKLVATLGAIRASFALFVGVDRLTAACWRVGPRGTLEG
jgi:hypothetical protein